MLSMLVFPANLFSLTGVTATSFPPHLPQQHHRRQTKKPNQPIFATLACSVLRFASVPKLPILPFLQDFSRFSNMYSLIFGETFFVKLTNFSQIRHLGSHQKQVIARFFRPESTDRLRLM
jgi:hypothetical protein